MNLKAIVGNALHGAASALGNVTQTHQPPATNTQANTSSANTGTLTDKQVREIIEHISTQQTKPSVFEEHVKQIDPKIVARRHIYDKPVIVELPKPSAKMTKPDYDHAFARAVLKKAGMTDAQDAEVAKFRNEYRRVTGGKFELTWNEQQLRAYQKQHGNQLPAHTNEYGLAVADAGRRQIHADRQEYAARVEQLRKEAQAYGTDALTGFYEVQMNAPLNLINDATKIVGLPEIPKFEVGGEYWKDKKPVAEAATTAGAAVLTGGAGLASDLLIIGSSAGNMAEATTGTDMRTGEHLSTTDRVLRGASGAAGAYAVRGRVDEITEGVAARAKNATKPPANASEAVTTEGVRVPVATTDEVIAGATQMEARGSKQLSGARGAKFEEQALEQARAAHPVGFKPDAEAQGLGYTNLKAADWVGLQPTKRGNYVAHITEVTVKNKPLSEIGKQLDGAQKIASAKMGDRIDNYEYYVRTNNKELADAIRRNGNKVSVPGGKGKINVIVISNSR